MSKLEIVKWPAEVLLKPTGKLKLVDGKTRELAEAMVETMYAAPGVGLAANQVGMPLSLAVVDVSPPEEERQLHVLVNPEIVHAEGSEVMSEGCLSLPGFTADVPRSEVVVVRAYDLDERPVEIEAEGLFARALQHEIDHLNGKLFPDRLSRLKKNRLYHKVRKAVKEGRFG